MQDAFLHGLHSAMQGLDIEQPCSELEAAQGAQVSAAPPVTGHSRRHAQERMSQLQHAELSMPELLDCIDELLLSNTQLANSVQVMEAEIRTHENIIQQRGAPLQAERHVLTAFHTDPAWLATQVTA